MENACRKTDRRVARTKRAIRNSFVKLLVEKELEKITIKEIADGADVDRKTVYNYYSGIYDILDELENELVQSFDQVMMKFLGQAINADLLFDALVGILKENMEIYGLLMRIDGNSRLVAKMVINLKEKIQLLIEWLGDMPRDKIEIATEYITAALFTAYRWWFNSARTKSIEEFTEDVKCIVLQGLPAYFIE